MKDIEAAETEKSFNKKPEREYCITNNIGPRKFETIHQNSDFTCQYNYRRDTQICTCKRAKHKRNKFCNSSHQVYRSQNKTLYSKALTDIGDVKILPKRRIKKIYLPEVIDIGVGSSVIRITRRRTNPLGSGYYEQKRTSSKCVGGFMVYIDVSVHDKNLSTIVQTQSDSTSPLEQEKNIDSGSYTVNKHSLIVDNVTVLDVKNNSGNDKIIKPRSTEIDFGKTVLTNKESDLGDNKKSSIARRVNKKSASSDSLVQHIYNFENADKYSRTSLVQMENKLEREYRKIFSMKAKQKKTTDEKQITDLKSVSIFRRRFEALRQGLGRKKDLKKDSIGNKVLSNTTITTKKDVAIVSDPPSLEARSYSKLKLHSSKILEPRMTTDSPAFGEKSFDATKENSNWSTDMLEQFQGAKGIFKLLGKKIDLEEDLNDPNLPKENSVKVSKNVEKNVKEILPKDGLGKTKKECKIFSFFKKKSKSNDKPKRQYKTKKNVTAERCEVGDGLMIKIGMAKTHPVDTSVPTIGRRVNNYDDILRKTWLKRFLTSKVDLKKSAQIRWNNKLYGTSSSTIFELMDCIYKNTDIVLSSKSEVNTGIFSAFTKPIVNFMQEDVKAWMIPKTILDRENDYFKNMQNSQLQARNIEVTFSNRKWLIDKSKAFSQNIEIILHSNNIVRQKKNSSEYITINIPQGYFSDTDSDNEDYNKRISDEEVYKIVEYETPTSNSYFKNKNEQRSMDTGDHNSVSSDIKVTVSIKDGKNVESKVLETIIKRPPLRRDVVVQGSEVFFPKRCDVIGFGIITQKDIRNIKQPIYQIPGSRKIQGYPSDADSVTIITSQKKCEFAESYLQDYYRNWTPLGIDLFSWCVSDSQLRGSSDNSLYSLYNQGDSSKSCPNIYDDYQATATMISSRNTSSCSQCWVMEKDKKSKHEKRKKKTESKSFSKYEDMNNYNVGKRVLPKDSLEVLKRRRMYAGFNKSRWPDDYIIPSRFVAQPYSVPSVEDKCFQYSSEDNVSLTPCSKAVEARKKDCQKRILLPDCAALSKRLSQQCASKSIDEILSFKGRVGCNDIKIKNHKQLQVDPHPRLQITQPCNKRSNMKKEKGCLKISLVPCDDQVSTPPQTCTYGGATEPPPISLCCKGRNPMPIPPCLHRSPYYAPRGSIRSTQSNATQLTPPRSTVDSCTNTQCCSKATPQKRVLTSSNPRFPSKSTSIPRSTKPSGVPQPRQQPENMTQSPKRDKSPVRPEPREKSSSRAPNPSSSKSHSPIHSPKKSPLSQLPIPRPVKHRSPPRRHGSPRHKSSNRSSESFVKHDSSPRSSPSSSRKRSPGNDASSQYKSSTRHTLSPRSRSPPSKHPSPHIHPGRSKRHRSPPRSDCCAKRKCPSRHSFPPCVSPNCRSACCAQRQFSTPQTLPSHDSPPTSKPFLSQCPALSNRPSQCLNFCKSPQLTKHPEPCSQTTSNLELPQHTFKLKNNGNINKMSSCISLVSAERIQSKPQGCLPKYSYLKCMESIKRLARNVANLQKSSIKKLKSRKPPSRRRSSMGYIFKKISKTSNENCSMCLKQKCSVCVKQKCSMGHSLIRLNSNEHLLIKLHQGTPSTDEIRENYNIKVKDEDGMTLYERRDYRRNIPHLVQNLYTNSRVHRISTSNIAKDVVCDNKSSENKIRQNTSLSNTVEINLTLKLKHKDNSNNNTTVITSNCGDNPVEAKNSKMGLKPPKEVFALQNQKKRKTKPSNSKDVNIKITINNYKEHDGGTSNDCISPLPNKEFSDKIGEKFRTVSTGYSEGVLGQQTYSIHQTTINLNNSAEKQINELALDPVSVPKSSLDNIVLSGVTVSDKHVVYVSELEKEQQIPKSDIVNITHKVSSTKGDISDHKGVITKTDSFSKETSKSEIYGTTEDIDDTYKNNVEKASKGKEFPVSILKIRIKERFKNILETESKLSGHHKKEKMELIRQMLTVIFSSHSSKDLSNQLADEVTYTSPDYLRDTDSMNNYCHVGSLSEKQSNLSDTEDQIYPTEEDNTSESNYEKSKERCFCSHIAAKLNVSDRTNAACSCKHGGAKKNEETNCDLKDEYFLNYSKYVNVEAQHSKFGKLNSVVMTNMSTTIRVGELMEKKDCAKSFRRRCTHNKKRRRISNEIINRSKKDSDFEKLNIDRLGQILRPEDILQLNETKKAVLEIYAEKTISVKGQHVVARLPKFVTNRESEILGYQEVLAGFKRLNTGASLPTAR